MEVSVRLFESEVEVTIGNLVFKRRIASAAQDILNDFALELVTRCGIDGDSRPRGKWHADMLKKVKAAKQAVTDQWWRKQDLAIDRVIIETLLHHE